MKPFAAWISTLGVLVACREERATTTSNLLAVDASPRTDASTTAAYASTLPLDAGATASRHPIDVAEGASRVSFGPDGKTLRVPFSDRLAFYDSATLVKQRELLYPAGTALYVDRPSRVLLGGAGFYLCDTSKLTCAPIPGGPDAATDEHASLTPGERLVVFGHADFKDTAWSFALRVYDASSRTWSRTVTGRAPNPAAGGLFDLCGITDTHVTWCHTRVGVNYEQDLRTGHVAVEPAKQPKSHWSAETNFRVTGPNAIEIVGPGPSRLVEQSGDQVAPRAITCGASNRALVVRAKPAQLELRTLPAWDRVKAWPVAAIDAACSADGTRVAFLATSNGKTTLDVVE